MVVKKCLNCGKEFITPKRNKKYCSHQCYLNVNGNYEPLNCRWVSQSVQNLNKRKGTK